MKPPKILIACPSAAEKDYCLPQFAEQLRSFTYPNYESIIIDNSADPNHVHKIAEHGINCVHFPRQGRPAKWLTECQNIIREYFLRSEASFLFMLESDEFVPKNIIEYMLMYRHPVHNISYFVNLERNNKETSLCAQMTTFTANGRITRMLSPELSFQVMDGSVQPFTDNTISYDTHVSHTGIGCTMIHRSVLEQIEFRTDPAHDRSGKNTYSDTFFHMDLELAGVPNYFDTNIIAKHYRHAITR